MSDYVEDLRIDDLELDREVIEQPALYRKYAGMANEMTNEYEDLKDFYASEKARIELEYRSGKLSLPEGVKGTEASIKAAVECNEYLIELKKEVNRKKRDKADMDSSTSAMDQRKHAISGSISLWNNGYNSEPYQNTNENVSERIKRKKGEN